MKLSHVAYIFAFGSLMMGNLAASCASDNTDSVSSSNDSRSLDRPGRIPRDSEKVRSGTGKLKWTTDLDGTFYVYDRDRDRVNYSGPVRRNQEIVVHPDEDRVYVAERVVSDEDLRRDSLHELYFLAQTRTSSQRPPRETSSSPVPDSAKRTARGSGNIELPPASRNGTAYLYDENDRKLLFKTDLRRGNSLKLIRSEGNVSVNGKQVKTISVPHGHLISIYYDED